MVKKVVIVSILLLAALSGGWYWLEQQQNQLTYHPLDAIPVGASMVIRVPDLVQAKDHLETMRYKESLGEIGELGSLHALSHKLDSLISSDAEMMEAVSDNPWYISYHSTKPEKLTGFYSLSLSKEVKNERLSDLMMELIGGEATISQNSYGLHNIIKAVISEPFKVIYLALVNGVVIASESEDLIKRSIDQLGSGQSLRKIPGFQKLLEVDGEHVDLNIYTNSSGIQDVLGGIAKKGSRDLVSVVAESASWAQMDVNFLKEGVMMNGFTFCSDSLGQLLQILDGQKPQTMDMAGILPANTATMLFVGVEDMSVFKTNHRRYLEEKGTLKAYEEKLDSLNNALTIDIEMSLFSWIGNSFGVAVTEPGTSSFARKSFLIVKTKNEALSNAFLKELDGQMTDKDPNVIAPVASQNQVDIYETEIDGLLPIFFGNSFTHLDLGYYMTVRDHVIFGQSVGALQQYVKNLIADTDLSKDIGFNRFSDNLSSTYNLFIYSKVNQSMPIYESYLSHRSLGVIEEAKQSIGEYGAVGLQLSNNNDTYYTNVFLSHDPDRKDEAPSESMATMDGGLVIHPQFVINHYTYDPEIVVQDDSNRLFLLDQFGQQIWQKQLEGPIRSEIYEVDAYKNKKHQILFNTDEKIYLLDRKGKDVDGYPIKLKAKAVTPLTLVEYDNNRDYRLLITCENKRIYNYTMRGNLVKGWKHNKAKDITLKQFQYLVHKGKDYLITAEQNGKVHLLDRRGKNRTKVAQRLPSFSNNPIQTHEGKNAAVFITDTAGTLFRIGLTGKVMSMKLMNMSSDHQFIAADLNGDGDPSFVFNDLNLLTVFDHAYQKVKELRVEPGTEGPFVVDLEEGRSGIGLFNPRSGLIHLYDQNLETLFNFPLNGTSRFDLMAPTEKRPGMVTSASEVGGVQIIPLD